MTAAQLPRAVGVALEDNACALACQLLHCMERDKILMGSCSLLKPRMTSDRHISNLVYNLLFSFQIHSDTHFCNSLPCCPCGLASWVCTSPAPPRLHSPMAALQLLLGQDPELSLALKGLIQPTLLITLIYEACS